MLRLFLIPRLALPALTRDSPLVLGIALERLKQNDSRKISFRMKIDKRL